MATMRPYRRRLDPAAFGLWAIGVLCGALLMIGITAVHHPSHPGTAASAVNKVAPAVTNQVAGLRDVQAPQPGFDNENIRHDPVGQSPASATADQLRVDQENMIRHDPAATLATGTGRITGPGEGLNQVQDTTSYEDGGRQPIVGPGEGMHQVP